MYLQKIPVKKSGRTLLTVVRSVWKDGKPKKEMVERIGYVDEFLHLYDDPIEHFKQVVREMTANEKEDKKKVTLEYSVGERLEIGGVNRKNIGYLPLSQLYEDLGLHRFFANRQRHLKIGYSLNAVFRLLTFGRCLYPGSKKRTYERRHRFFEPFDFSLDDVYRSLAHLHRYASDLKVFLHNQIVERYQRRTDVVYYDVTNYYFETDQPDALRKRGVSKEHRPNPIVQMGLLMDSQGMPVTYELFSGNTNDCETLMPVLYDVREQFQIDRLIVVADRGLNTTNNMAMAIAKGDGYIYGQSVLKATDELKSYGLKEDDYVHYGEESSGFKIKSRIVPKTIHVENMQGKKVAVEIDQKQVFFFSDKYRRRAQAQRQEAIDKALSILRSPGQVSSSYGAMKYLKDVSYDKATGEVLDPGKTYYLDEERIALESQYDGYYVLVTSELDMPDHEVMDHYRGLWRIEETFRVTKSDLETRPVYVSREDHINAHFLICFVALLFTRLLQVKTGYRFSATALLHALRFASGTELQSGTYVFDYYDACLEELGKQFKIPFDRKFLNQTEIKKGRKPR